MRARRTLVVPLLLLALVPGCGEGPGDASAPPSGTTSEAAPSSPSASPSGSGTRSASPSPTGTTSAGSVDLADGRHPVRIVDLDVAGMAVTVDVVQLFTGKDAVEAAEEDGSPEVPPPNDYWIRNENDRLRTLSVVLDAPVTTNTVTAMETGDSRASVDITFEHLASLDGVDAAVFWVTLEDSNVVRLDEQYLP